VELSQKENPEANNYEIAGSNTDNPMEAKMDWNVQAFNETAMTMEDNTEDKSNEGIVRENVDIEVQSDMNNIPNDNVSEVEQERKGSSKPELMD
jgi:hypothetical protein